MKAVSSRKSTETAKVPPKEWKGQTDLSVIGQSAKLHQPLFDVVVGADFESGQCSLAVAAVVTLFRSSAGSFSNRKCAGRGHVTFDPREFVCCF
ncbi:hypothetical protein M7I_2801 [Glarea lozoyensis 74030]|uniref:Uncharacterized protein n=1 Tax=Glarea lozoyensis (strain ATCC 74030 / MF5533) TaxID=1104152 RepID=H0EJS1_GLAL7|nr:hypothetical protein M7I_2801 [Glarea lozoyensis 74030]